jgi:hypothetical protein
LLPEALSNTGLSMLCFGATTLALLNEDGEAILMIDNAYLCRGFFHRLATSIKSLKHIAAHQSDALEDWENTEVWAIERSEDGTVEVFLMPEDDGVAVMQTIFDFV